MDVLLMIIGVVIIALNVFTIIQVRENNKDLYVGRCENLNRDFKTLDLIKELVSKLNMIESLIEEKDDLDEVKEIIKSIPNKINDDYLRIAEETWRLHNRITRAEIDKHIIQKEAVGTTPNHKRQELGLDPIESCDEPYVEGLEHVDDKEAFK